MHNSGRDDGFHAPEADESVAESVLTSTLGAYVLPRWGALLRSLSPPNRATQADRAESFGDGLRVALLDQVLHNERGEVVALIRVSKSPPPPRATTGLEWPVAAQGVARARRQMVRVFSLGLCKHLTSKECETPALYLAGSSHHFCGSTATVTASVVSQGGHLARGDGCQRFGRHFVLGSSRMGPAGWCIRRPGSRRARPGGAVPSNQPSNQSPGAWQPCCFVSAMMIFSLDSAFHVHFVLQVASLVAQCRNKDWVLGFGYRCINTIVCHFLRNTTPTTSSAATAPTPFF